MNSRRKLGPWIERLALVVLSPLLFMALAELAIWGLGIETEVARNANAEIALPVWLLADETWVADRQAKTDATGERAIAAEEVAWLHHFEEARWIQYRMKPDVDVRAVNPFSATEVEKGVTFRLTSNGSGFRDREFAPKPAARVRIVTIGDSSTFGWGAEPEHTYQRLLEDRLEVWRPGRFEVLNLGVPGHNTRHGIGMLEHYALPLDPDILIVGYGANDPRRVPTATSQLLAIDDTALGALRFAALRLRTYRLMRRLRLELSDPLARSSAARTAPDDLVAAVPIDDFRANLFDLARTARGHGATPIFLSVCTPNRLIVATTRDVAAAEDVAFLDVAYLFEEAIDPLRAGTLYPQQVEHYRRIYGRAAMRATRSLYVASDGCHPHWIGHSLIADRLFEMIRTSLGQPVLPEPVPGDPQ